MCFSDVVSLAFLDVSTDWHQQTISNYFFSRDIICIIDKLAELSVSYSLNTLSTECLLDVESGKNVKLD